VLGGKSKPKSDVDKAVAELGVQVGNLCSFLPQDRVNEFAKLKPEELLVETQKVAGHEKLTTWHEQLIEMGKGLKEIKEVHFVFSMLRLRQLIAYRLICQALATDQQDCSNEEGKNQVLERDVQAFNKRKQLEEEVSELLPSLRITRPPVAHYILGGTV
jgi:structural maintenance of chromosomes protein 5